jgi:protein-disulfide isomerase
MSGISADKKAAVLKLMREQDCTCKCGMKMAQCRFQDPKCAFSRMAANAAVEAMKEGKTPDQMRAAALAQNHLKILEDFVKIPVEGEPTKGPAGARITLVEFSDFQCPWCARAASMLDDVVRSHSADVRLVYKQYPIVLIHNQAVLAAHASLAANKQGKFWPLHDLMFNNNSKLSKENIVAWAKQINMDMPKFLKDMDSKEVDENVIRDIKDGDDAGVLGTPTVYVNGHRYNGEMSGPELTKVIEGELKK